VLDDAKGSSHHKNAQELLARIEKRADDQLAHARELKTQGKMTEAFESLTELLRSYPGIRAAKGATELMSTLLQANSQLKTEQRARRATELLTQARDFYKSKDYIPCLDRCEIIVANYGDLPEGQQAFALIAEIKNNPQWLQAAADVMSDRLGGVWLALADSYLKRGEAQKAEFYLKRVVQAFPGSRLAESAQIRLSQLQTARPEPQSAGP
jgi:outer membrane protein assembly factor BamD (BamD/ComL family)